MEKLVLTVSTDKSKKSFHGKTYFDIFHRSNRGIAPWKTKISQITLSNRFDNALIKTSFWQIGQDVL